jgi:hypothetical protein
MIDRAKLLNDLQALVRKLEADLLERSDSFDVPEVGETLRSDYQIALQAKRTAQSYEELRSDSITQMASAWVLSGVFVRFLEDNQLVEPPMISGVGERLQRARDAPAFRIQVVCGDSLLHGEGNQLLLGDWAPMAHYFRSEDAAELNRILIPGRYHAVVANPPYITPKDVALSQAYREWYKETCYRH